jgi:predicted nucleic-acid-binding protein
MALRSYESSSADFADHLVGILNQDRGCETTYTFDRKAGRLASHRLVELG